MIRLLVAVAVVSTLTSFNPETAAKSNDVGWTSLFGGRSLTGWTPEQTAQWHVSGGLIVGDAGGDGWLRSRRQFRDFAMKIDYRNSPKGNSGIFLRATRESKAADPSNPSGGYELQINNEDPSWATGSIENFIQRLVPVNPAPNEWHSYEVEVRGDHLIATLDNVKVLDGHDPKFKAGCIGLQHHRDNRIEFRNILVKPL
jgi:hypothetical protein